VSSLLADFMLRKCDTVVMFSGYTMLNYNQ